MPTNLVKSELKQAKQQSHELHRTGDYFNVLFTQGSGQAPPKPPLKDSSQESQTNGILHPVKLGSMSAFSQPPAPPPQQPLPKKPDISRSILPDSNGQHAFKRTETERPGSSGKFSPLKTETSSSQILSLIEALTSAKRQIDSQGDRVKQLEDLLQQERKARESAEERARRLLETRPRESCETETSIEEDAFNPPSEHSAISSGSLIDNRYAEDTIGSRNELNKRNNATESSQESSRRSKENWQRNNHEVNASTFQLQQKLDVMIREMDEMKLQMEEYKCRAEGAEDEKNSLAEMVQRLRNREDNIVTNPEGGLRRRGTEMATQTDSLREKSPTGDAIDATNLGPLIKSQSTNQNGTAVEHMSNLQDLQKAISSTLAHPNYQQDKLVHCAPYASMLGVVIIGVGIMTYLNSWQKVDR